MATGQQLLRRLNVDTLFSLGPTGSGNATVQLRSGLAVSSAQPQGMFWKWSISDHCLPGCSRDITNLPEGFKSYENYWGNLLVYRHTVSLCLILSFVTHAKRIRDVKQKCAFRLLKGTSHCMWLKSLLRHCDFFSSLASAGQRYADLSSVCSVVDTGAIG